MERKSLSSKPKCGYVKPEMKIVKLKARTSLLQGSGSQDPIDDLPETLNVIIR